MPNRTSPLSPARPTTTVGTRPSRTAALLGGPAPILTAAVLWGTTGTASSLAPAGAPAAAIGCAGLALGGILLLLTSRSASRSAARNASRRASPTAPATPGARSLVAAATGRERWLLLLGALAVAGYPVTFYPAVARTGVAVATVIALGSAPVFAGLLAWLTGQSRPTARWTVATATAVLGCTLLVLGPELSGRSTPTDLTGVALAACGGLSYAVYSLIGGRLITHGHPSGEVMGVLFGAAGLIVLPLVLLTDTHWLTTVRGAAVAVYLALFTVFLAYRLFGHGLRRTPASVATSLTLAEPAVAAVLGVTVLDERLPLASWSGLTVLTLALVLLTFPSGRAR